MAHAEITTDFNGSHSSALSLITAPFRAIGTALVWLAENDSRLHAARKLQETSDEALAARGTTRADEIRRIFAASGAI